MGNPKIGNAGRGVTRERSADCDARLQETKRRIEEELRLTNTLKKGRVTVQSLLRQAGLNPTFLEKKPQRIETKRETQEWMREVNDRLDGGSESPEPLTQSDGLGPVQKLQNAYASLMYEHIDRLAKLEKAHQLIEDLVKENSLLRERSNA